jgi:hypothetical protein
MFLAILTWGYANDALELIIKMGRIVKANGITNLRNADVVVHQHLAGIANFYLIQKLDIGFIGMRLEEATKGSRTQMSDLCDFFQTWILCVIIHNKLIDLIDSVSIILGKSAGEGFTAQ